MAKGFLSTTRLLLSVAVAGCIGLTACSTEPVQKNLTREERARLFIEAANGALQEGDATGALQFLKKAEEIDDALPELHHTRALALYRKQDLATAIEEARKAVSLAKNYSDAWNTYGKLLMDAGRYREAEEPLLRAASDHLYREAYKAHTNLGILYYRLDRGEKATPHLNKAIQEAPVLSCIAYYYRGHLHLRNGNLRGAAADYEKATQKICAGFVDAHLALGIAYERSRQYDRARKKYLDIRQSFPNTKVAEQAMDRLRYLP